MGYFFEVTLKNIIVLFLISFLFSCVSSPDVNFVFEQEYGQEIEQIKKMRANVDVKDPNQVFEFVPPNAQEVLNEQVEKNSYVPFSDVRKFGESPQSTYLPAAEVYEQTKKGSQNQLLPDMFYISYGTDLHSSFQRIGVEFDAIDIPQEDAYGVKTEMSQKTYLLAGNDSLKGSVDEINNSRKKEDYEISEILIKEQKQINRRNKMARIFGSDKGIQVVENQKK